jgi:hypothetical protein
MPLLVAEGRAKERIDDLGSSRLTDDSRSQCQNVHVIVFNSLVGCVVIVNDGSSGSGDLVCGKRSSSSGSTNDDASFALPVDDFASNGSSEVRVVDRVGRVGSEVGNRMACGVQMSDQQLFQLETCMV